MNDNKFYLDEPCVVSFWIGELGWFLQRFQGFMRYLKKENEELKDHKFIIFMTPHLHPFVADFMHCTIALPDWFNELGLDSDCYEAPPTNSPGGSLTQPTIYGKLIQDMRQYYNFEKAVEIFPPRGCNFWVDSKKQIFARYESDEKLENINKPIITVFPRARSRAADRNIHPHIWYETVMSLSQNFLVVLAGTPNGACLQDLQSDSIVNLINYDGPDKTDKIVKYLSNSVCCVSSQSGGSHIGMLCDCPSYIIGHQKERHAEKENRLGTPISFRYVVDYRIANAEMILTDVGKFIQALNQHNQDDNSFDGILSNDLNKLKDVIDERGDNV